MKKKILMFASLPLLLAGCVKQAEPVKTTPTAQGREGNVYEERLRELERKVAQIEAKTVENSAKIRVLNERTVRAQDRLVSDEKDIYETKKKVENIERMIKSITVSATTAADNETSTGMTPQFTPMEQPSKEVTTPEVMNVSDEDIYKKAFNAMESGELDTARILFETLVKKYPDSPLADNALYWLGEIFYSHGDYSTALNYFKKVVNNYGRFYPSSKGNKVPAALLKEALCYKGLEDYSKAKTILKEVIKTYPSTNEAAIAKVKLMEIGE